MLEKANKLPQLVRVLQDFPSSIKFSFAYGSGAFRQKSDPLKNMLDLVFVVQDPASWHQENLRRNPAHYSQLMRTFGHKSIARFQETWGAHVYYNTLITTSEGRNIKYGVISEKSLVEDLLDWNFLYLSGRLHKPVHMLVKPEDNSQLDTSLKQNLQSAIHAALLLLPEHFTELNFYKSIAALSYNGDFRMVFGEDKDKVSNIVLPQLQNFRELYSSVLPRFGNYMDVQQLDRIAITCRQDISPMTRIYHLNQLPRTVQKCLVKTWVKGKQSKDTEDCLRAIAYDPECSSKVDFCLRKIVWNSSISQSLKGIITAGIVKSIVYSAKKIQKMLEPGSWKIKENKMNN